MSSSDIQARVGEALVKFAVNSQYADEEAVIASNVEGSFLPGAIELLKNARSALEDDIRKKSQDAAPEIDTWVEQAKALQDDIEFSRQLATDIIQKAEADEQRDELENEQLKYVAFMEEEVAFNDHLGKSLLMIEEIYEHLQRAELLLGAGSLEPQVTPCLDALQHALKLIPEIHKTAGTTTTEVARLLYGRASDLRSTAIDVLQKRWESMITIDHGKGKITIQARLKDEFTTAGTATFSMSAAEILQEEVKQFWCTLDDVIVKPRTDLSRPSLRYIHIKNNTIYLGEETADSTLESLFTAMEDLIRYLLDHFPAEFIKPLSTVMMPELSARLKEFWLDTAVPSSVDEVHEYSKSMHQVHQFASSLEMISWPGWETLDDWTKDAPKLWINKRREISLDFIRTRLEFGIGIPFRAEHFERQMVGLNEGKQIASSANVVSQDWDAAWNSDDEEDPLPSRRTHASLEEEEARKASEVTNERLDAPDGDDDDTADAWGWGDEATTAEQIPEHVPELPSDTTIQHSRHSPETREITLSELYTVSSIPRSVFDTVTDLFNDGAKLTSPEFENSPVTSAAPGLFHLPKLVLTMYRAVSPFHYARHPCGNMFTYNDSIWLCDELRVFQSEWDQRNNLSPRAFNKVVLGPEIKILESFGKRAYTNELNAQRTVITDLLGGAQNFFTENGSFNMELDAEIGGVTVHVRQVSALWEPMLQYSAWVSSIGSLVNTVCSKIISDVFDLDGVGTDQAERLSAQIEKIMELEDLFTRGPNPRTNGSVNGGDVQQVDSAVDQFVDRWMALKSLKLLLESNLEDIKFFWFEGALSDHLTAEEVVELIGLSFENNVGVRHLKREIMNNTSPRGS